MELLFKLFLLGQFVEAIAGLTNDYPTEEKTLSYNVVNISYSKIDQPCFVGKSMNHTFMIRDTGPCADHD